MNERDLSLPGPREGRSHDEIAAEITDHLASKEAELMQRGATAEEARAVARRKFGDVEKFQKTCYWIQNGETIMLRWTLISLAAVLCILLGLSVLGNWRAQSQLADEMGKLSAELKSLAAAKQTPPPAPLPPEITGVIYEGSKDKPLAGASVTILRADGSVVRRLSCDEKGVYRSGPLEGGDYSVTTPLPLAPASYSQRIAQSQPIFLHAASGSITLDLDAAYHAGGLKLSVNRKLPAARKEGSYLISSRINVFVIRSRERAHPWTAKENSPNRWPIYCYADLPVSRTESRSARGIDIEGISPASRTFILTPGEEREFLDHNSKDPAIFPPDDTEIEATLLLSVVPLNEQGNIVVPAEKFFQLKASVPDLPDNLDNFTPDQKGFAKTRTIPASLLDAEESYLWQFLTGGHIWLSKLKDFSLVGGGVYSRDSIPRQKAAVKDGRFTRIVFDVPEGIEEEIHELIASTPDAEEFEKRIHAGFFQRPLTFRVVGDEPMEK